MSRTKAQKAQARKLLGRPAGKLEPIDLTSRDSPEWLTRAFSNNRYVVMINDEAQLMGAPAIKVMVQRHDDVPITGHWKELQNIKNELFGRESLAVECYPPESELVDVANIYWIWVIPSKARLNV
jgi:hypothetical protein